MSKSIGVVIGRFQTPYLHKGHHQLLLKVEEECDKVIILIGNSPLRSTKRNALTYTQREVMLQEFLPDAQVLSLKDCRSNEEWSERVDLICSVFSSEGDEEVILYGGRDSFIPSYKGIYPTLEIAQVGDHSATEIRKNIDPNQGGCDFREGVIVGASNRWINAKPCVDIACFKGRHLILGRKKGETEWRLPGGFVDPGESYEEAAARELMEETCCTGDKMVYAGSFVVDDWRYNGEEEQITTALFKCNYTSGSIFADDDLEEIDLFHISLLPPIVSGHVALIDKLLGDKAC